MVEWAGEDGLTVEIVISGSFDERRRIEFSNAFSLIPENVNHIVVDLAKTTFIDSAAVGMLLGLRTFCSVHNIGLVLKSCESPVRSLLERACVESLFKFE